MSPFVSDHPIQWQCQEHQLKLEVDRLMADLQLKFLEDTASSTPIVTELAQYYFMKPSKRLRPRLVVTTALATVPPGLHISSEETGLYSDSISAQLKLAEAVEMIHVASLLHDDVIDESSLRRGSPSSPAVFGNKKTVLGGDYLLGRAIGLCANLSNSEVTKLIAGLISTLVEGELSQASTCASDAEAQWTDQFWESYLAKTYMKTASLFSDSLRASVLLWGPEISVDWVEAASSYGKELGMAFQIADDILDYVPTDRHCESKPHGADLRLGLTTAPLFFAMQESPSLKNVLRSLADLRGDDVDQIIMAVRETNALERSRQLVLAYAENAQVALSALPVTAARSALLSITEQVVDSLNDIHAPSS